MATDHRQFFGDGERTFRLDATAILELERLTGAGIGSIARRLFAGDFRLVEVHETIRLALVGGGEDPKRAVELIAAYIAGRPIAEAYEVAVAVMEHAWFGRSGDGSVQSIAPAPGEPA